MTQQAPHFVHVVMAGLSYVSGNHIDTIFSGPPQERCKKFFDWLAGQARAKIYAPLLAAGDLAQLVLSRHPICRNNHEDRPVSLQLYRYLTDCQTFA
ncbi:MAG: hypothetical protein WC100_07125 [Sterolibacterium sp.]